MQSKDFIGLHDSVLVNELRNGEFIPLIKIIRWKFQLR